MRKGAHMGTLRHVRTPMHRRTRMHMHKHSHGQASVDVQACTRRYMHRHTCTCTFTWIDLCAHMHRDMYAHSHTCGHICAPRSPPTGRCLPTETHAKAHGLHIRKDVHKYRGTFEPCAHGWPDQALACLTGLAAGLGREPRCPPLPPPPMPSGSHPSWGWGAWRGSTCACVPCAHVMSVRCVCRGVQTHMCT